MRALSPDRAAQSGLPATTQGIGGSTSRPRGHLPSKHGAWDSDRTTRSTSGRFTVGGGNTRLRVEGQSACLHCSHHAATLIVGSTGSGVQALGEFTEAVRRRRGSGRLASPRGVKQDVRPSTERSAPPCGHAATRPALGRGAHTQLLGRRLAVFSVDSEARSKHEPSENQR